jgi:hypothetical protein
MVSMGKGKRTKERRKREAKNKDKEKDSVSVTPQYMNDFLTVRRVSACYDKYKRFENREDFKDILFKNYHFTSAEIEAMLYELNRIKTELQKKPAKEITSVFFDVDKISDRYKITSEESEEK